MSETPVGFDIPDHKKVRVIIDTDDTSSTPDAENPLIRLYTDVDSRYIIEDLIAKLELFSLYQEEASPPSR